ncbi:MAG: hypothetical protein RQ760_20330 [Sedimentisphaerales bacterium]|nr:hypothetical protein [Sedimentisphaerales bacterium]
MQEMPNHQSEIESTGAPYRRHILTCYIILMLIWTVGGLLVWCGVPKEWLSETMPEWMRPFFVHFAFLTWPAHEASLYLTGKGLGSNALLEFSVLSVSTFFVWSGILWGPVLMLRWRKIPVWAGIMALVLLLILTFGLFWRYGNG